MNAERQAQIMTVQADILSTSSDAMRLDLAVAPIVLASQPGIGVINMLKDLGPALGMPAAYIRCMDLEPDNDADWQMIYLRETIAGNNPGLVILAIDEEVSLKNAQDILSKIDSANPLIIALCVPLSFHDAALTAVQQSLGIHPALVPSRRLSMGKIENDVLLIGTMSQEGSKIGLHFVDIDCETPYEHTVSVIIKATEDQNDDALNEALESLWTGEVAIRARLHHGSLYCQASDIISL